MQSKKLSYYMYLICVFVLLALMVTAEFFLKLSFDDPDINDMLKTATVNTIGTLAALVFILYNKTYTPLISFDYKNSIYILPYLAVVLSNFPFIALIFGKALLVKGSYHIISLILKCLSIGLFEEFMCRLIIFPIIIDKCKDKKRNLLYPIIISSVLFGLLHLINLFFGGSPGATLLQVLYSCLIGAMCSLCLLITRSIWIPVILHALFDFGGFFVNSLCNGVQWDIPSGAVMVVFSVFAFFFSFKLLKKLSYETALSLFGLNDK